VRLGWSHGDQEIFSTEEMIAAFDLPQIGRSPARFDFAKLESLNGHYMRQSGDQDLLAAMEQLLPHIDGGADLAATIDPTMRERLLKAMPGLKDRAKTLIELIDSARFLFPGPPIPFEPKAEALLTPDARALLGHLKEKLEQVVSWSAASTEDTVRAFAEAHGVKLGTIAQPLRAALTHRATSPGIFEVLDVLGKHESLKRMANQARPTRGSL
jgi:glutamyl-tRNA synthetase